MKISESPRKMFCTERMKALQMDFTSEPQFKLFSVLKKKLKSFLFRCTKFSHFIGSPSDLIGNGKGDCDWVFQYSCCTKCRGGFRIFGKRRLSVGQFFFMGAGGVGRGTPEMVEKESSTLPPGSASKHGTKEKIPIHDLPYTSGRGAGVLLGIFGWGVRPARLPGAVQKLGPEGAAEIKPTQNPDPYFRLLGRY